MKILSSVLIIVGLLMVIGGVAGLYVGNSAGIIRLLVGAVLVVVAFSIRPRKAVADAKADRR